MVILLTGPINSGKTTLLSGAAERLRAGGSDPAGLITLKEFDGARRIYTALNLATGRRRKLLEVEAGVITEARGGFAFAARALGGCRLRTAFVDEFGVIELSGGGYAAEALALAGRRGAHTVIAVREGILREVKRLPALRGARVVRLSPGRPGAAARRLEALLDGRP